MRSITRIVLFDMNIVDKMLSYDMPHLIFKLLNSASRKIRRKLKIHSFDFKELAPLFVVTNVVDNLVLMRFVEKIMLQHRLLPSYRLLLVHVLRVQQSCEIIRIQLVYLLYCR